MKRKRKQSDLRQRTLPFPSPPQKIMSPEWEVSPVSEPPSSKPLKQQLLFGQRERNLDYFYWPTTNVTAGDGSLAPSDWPKIGLLRYYGYVVGEKGKPRSSRRAILTRVFELSVLPNLVSPNYILKWGDARSSARLKKMAYSIALFCQADKRKKRVWIKRAIDNYEDDLAWLKKEYYDGRFDQKFKWPVT